MSELLPCPFCEFTAPEINESDDGRWQQVVCGGCGAKGPEQLRMARVTAASSWNRRAERPAISPELRKAMKAGATALSERGEFHIYENGAVYTRAQCNAMAAALESASGASRGSAASAASKT